MPFVACAIQSIHCALASPGGGGFRGRFVYRVQVIRRRMLVEWGLVADGTALAVLPLLFYSFRAADTRAGGEADDDPSLEAAV